MAIKIAKPISEFEVVSPNTPESTPEQPEVPALVCLLYTSPSPRDS